MGTSMLLLQHTRVVCATCKRSASTTIKPFRERFGARRRLLGTAASGLWAYNGKQKGCRPLAQNASFLAFHTANLDSWLLAQNLVSVLRRTGSADSAEHLRSSCRERPGCSKAG